MKTLTSSFTTPKNLIFSHFITLLCVIFILFCPKNVQNIVSGLGILSFGILHGANDLKILSKKNPKKQHFFGIPFWAIYIGVVFLGIITFYFIPSIALFSFVAVSCYHFGEQHWQAHLSHIKNTAFFFSAYGALIFLMLFSFHYEEVKEVIFQISGIQLSFDIFWITLVFVGFLVFLLMLIYIKDKKELLVEFLLLGLLAIIFYQGSLLFGFGLYFVLWHSLPSLQSQIGYLFGNDEKSPFRQYFKSAFLYWVIALIGLFASYFFGMLPKDQYLSVFFSFLAAITFPHVVVMGLMFHSSKQHSR